MTKHEPAIADGSPGVVYRGIVDGLYRGRYVPGQRLVEADLTRDFEVGRGSVREALSRLAAEGLADTRPKVSNRDINNNPLPANQAINRRVAVHIFPR